MARGNISITVKIGEKRNSVVSSGAGREKKERGHGLTSVSVIAAAPDTRWRPTALASWPTAPDCP